MVGTTARMRASSVISSPASGTLKSARSKTRRPRKSTWTIVNFIIAHPGLSYFSSTRKATFTVARYSAILLSFTPGVYPFLILGLVAPQMARGPSAAW